MCRDCPNKATCKQICPKLEKMLNSLDHSLNSAYMVSFVDPMMLDEIHQATVYGKAQVSPRRQKLYRRLDHKLESLRNKQKDCIVHYYGLRGNASISQYRIAKLLNISQNTVWYHLTKAKTFLKVKLKR